MEHRTVGVLGGGQLGRMMVEAANKLGIRIAILDPGSSSSPAGNLSQLSIEGSFKDSAKVRELATISDVLTTEIEHINTDALEELEKTGFIVRPNAKTVKTIQDKLAQKQHLSTFDVSMPHFMDVPDVAAAYTAGARYGYPYMLKNRFMAYDGRGNAIVKDEASVQTAFDSLGGNSLYAEKMISFVKELAVMVVRTSSSVVAYPVVETVQQNNICKYVIAPALVSATAASAANALALKAIEAFDGVGIYGVELFLLNDDTVLLNEIAPRPHNSGHYTIESCEIDQFEMHLRAVLDLPCPQPKMKVGAAMMVNILGAASGSMEDTTSLLRRALHISGAGVHWYGKGECRSGRKMAHVTITAEDFPSLREKIELLGITADEHGLPAQGPKVGIIMGSDSDLPVMKDAAEILDKFQVPYELTIVSAHRTPTRMYSYAQTCVDRGIQVLIAGAGGAAHLPGMVAALTSLPVIGVPIKTSTLNGQDSLLSIVQMPKGIPVATVAIGGAANAGLLAVRVLGSRDPALLQKMDEFMIAQESDVLKKAASLEDIGYAAYLANK